MNSVRTRSLVGRTGRASGFVLVELALALAVVLLLAVWAAQGEVSRAKDAAARASGTWLLEIQRAMRQLIRTHHDALVQGRAPVGRAGQPLFLDARAPTLSEIKAVGHLPSEFPERSALGFGVKIAIAVSGCPGQGCRLDALAFTDEPVGEGGGDGAGIDVMAIAEVLGMMNGLGAWVAPGAAQRVRGTNVDMPNPVRPSGSGWPVGTVAAWAGLDRSSALQYLRVGDTRDPDFKGNVSVGGAVSSRGSLATEGSVRAQGSVLAQGSVVAQESVLAQGNVLAQGDVRAQGSVLAREDVFAQGVMRAGRVVEAGAQCGSIGAIARGVAGAILSCSQGAWQAPTDGFGGAFATNSRHGCKKYGGEPMHNPRTGGCSCPSGYAAIAISEGGRWYERGGWTQGYVCMR